MEIKVWEYLREYHNEKEEILAAIEEVLESGWLILGSKVKAFEAAYAEYSDTKYGIGVAIGTEANTLALEALGVGPGDEVITVSNTAITTVSAIVTAGATPVFVDIHEDTYLMNASLIESAITPKTKCIIPVHLYGQCVDMDAVNAIAKKHKLFVLEDCAQSHGALYKGAKAGSLSDISTTSFYPTKILGTYGDGGMVNTNNEELDKKMRRLRFYGAEKTYYAIEHGHNSRLDEMHASILLKKIKHLDEYIRRRQELAKRYDEMLKDTSLILPVEATYGKHAYYIYVVRHPERESVMEELKQAGIIVNISYPWPIHTMTGYAQYAPAEGSLSVTEKMAKEIFSIPMFPSLTDEQQLYVIEKLKEICK